MKNLSPYPIFDQLAEEDKVGGNNFQQMKAHYERICKAYEGQTGPYRDVIVIAAELMENDRWKYEMMKTAYETEIQSLCKASPELLEKWARRLMSWPLPDHIHPDGEYPAGKYREKWGSPLTGTNLIDLDTAKQMFEYCLE